MTGQIDLFRQPAPKPRCAACETPLVVKQNDGHIQTAYVCCNPHCAMYGFCLTCQMLMAWFAGVDAGEAL